jgi:xylan 1,4-beta-xylosidase
VLTNFALPRHSLAVETVHFTLRGAQSISRATIRRIDSEHGNAKARWEQMGEPEYLTAPQLTELDAASRLSLETQPISLQDGILSLEVVMPPLSVAVIELA